MDQTIQKLQKGAGLVFVMLSIFLLVKTFTEIKTYSNIGMEAGQNIISVSGVGEVFATADIASFTYSVEQDGATVAEAQKKAGEISEKAVKVLKDAGVEDKDIKTTGYNVGPKYDYNVRPCTAYSCPPSNPKIVGYTVNNSVSVKVRKIDDAGKILSNLGETGVSNLSSLDFMVDDEETLKDEAREIAIKDARAKAKKLAKDLDVSLGSVLSFSENAGGYPVPMYSKAYGMGGADVASAPEVNIQTGENKIMVNVNITYRIR